jgi:hypothetical protein
MDFGDLLVRSSVRLAMLCYAGVLLGSILGRHAPATTSGSRWLWTLGCGLYWVHVLSAFAFYHHWSHAHAFADTAARTQAAIGFEFGYGIYVNHLFTLVWTADVMWSWLAPKRYAARPRWATIAILAFMLFIAVNGLMVFKEGPVRWASATVLAALVALWAALAAWRMLQPTSAPGPDEAASP